VTVDAEVTIETSSGELTGPLEGRAAIGEFYGARLAVRSQARRHLTTNVIVDLADEEQGLARTRATLALISERDGAFATIATGTYRDQLRRDEDGVWRIHRRHIFLEVPSIPDP
jgi:3-phenylpropionate/cinnamic acid dioxygenase small subunit